MASEHMFGCGPGHLPERANRTAAKHGAALVNHTDPQCNCGYGCRPFTCERSQRHWFTCRNYGSPHNERIAAAVLAAVQP